MEGKFDDDAASSVDYHARSETYRTEFDFVTRPVSDAVVTAVAYAQACDPLELPPLFQTIDPDALDSVFAPRNGRHQQQDASLEFEYADHTITVNSYGTVELESADRP